MLNPARVQDTEARLYELLGAELDEVVRAVTDGEFLIQLPESYAVDKDIYEINSLVARTSNTFGRAARFAGIARAEAKLARGRYERKYKQSRKGSNEHAREDAAMAACEVEHAALCVADSVAEMADAMESAARVASESARRIQTSVMNQSMAGLRESHGMYKEGDFHSVNPTRPY